MKDLIIVPKKDSKGRAFRALALAYVEAKHLWELGNTEHGTVRPAWIMLSGSDDELRAFVANLRSGRKAKIDQANSSATTFELLKSAGYRYESQRLRGATTIRAYLPNLFDIDPGMVDPSGISFCVLPDRCWLAAQQLDYDVLTRHMRCLGAMLDAEQLRDLAQISALFAVYLDRRTRCPLYVDSRFHLQLLCACLNAGLASLGCTSEHRWGASQWGHHPRMGFHEHFTGSVGLAPGIAFKASHEEFEQLLAEETRSFFEAARKASFQKS